MKKFHFILRVIAIALIVAFAYQDILWANPDISAHSSLQIDSFISSVPLDGLNPENALRTLLQYIRQAVDLGSFSLSVSRSFTAADGQVVDIGVDFSPQGKRMEGDSWRIPCSIVFRGAAAVGDIYCYAVISNGRDGPVELDYPNAIREEASIPTPERPAVEIKPDAGTLSAYPEDQSPRDEPDGGTFPKIRVSIWENIAMISFGLAVYAVFQLWLGYIGRPMGLTVLVTMAVFPLFTFCVQSYLEHETSLRKKESIFSGMENGERRNKRRELIEKLLALLEKENPEIRNPDEDDVSKKDPYIKVVRIVRDLGNRISEFKRFGNAIQINESFFTKNGYEDDLEKYAAKIFWRFRLVYMHEREHAKHACEDLSKNFFKFIVCEILSVHAEHTALFRYSKNGFVRYLEPVSYLLTAIYTLTYIYGITLATAFIFIPYFIFRTIRSGISYSWYKIANPRYSFMLLVMWLYKVGRKHYDIGPRVAFDEAVRDEYAAVVTNTFRRVVGNNIKGSEILAEYLLSGKPDRRLLDSFDSMRNREWGSAEDIDIDGLNGLVAEIADANDITGLPPESVMIRHFPEFASLVSNLEDIYYARVEERLHNYEGEKNPLPAGKDDPTYGTEMQAVVAHAYRVARLVKLLGSRMGLNDDELKHLTLAALLHDVGKAEVIEIITQPRKLSREEIAMVNEHAMLSSQIILDKLSRAGNLEEDEVPFNFGPEVSRMLDSLTYGLMAGHHMTDIPLMDEVTLATLMATKNNPDHTGFFLMDYLEERERRPKLLVNILAACDILDAMMDMSRLYLGGRPKQLPLIFEIMKDKKKIDSRVIAGLEELSREDIWRDEGGRTLFEIIMGNQLPFLRLQTGVTMAAFLGDGIWRGGANPLAVHGENAYFDGQRNKCYEAVIDSNLALKNRIDLIRLIDQFTSCVIKYTDGKSHKGSSGADLVLEQVETPVLLYDSSYRVDLSRETVEKFMSGVPVIIKGSRSSLEELYMDFRNIAMGRLFGQDKKFEDLTPGEVSKLEAKLKNIYALELAIGSVKIVPLEEMLAPPVPGQIQPMIPPVWQMNPKDVIRQLETMTFSKTHRCDYSVMPNGRIKFEAHQQCGNAARSLALLLNNSAALLHNNIATLPPKIRPDLFKQITQMSERSDSGVIDVAKGCPFTSMRYPASGLVLLDSKWVQIFLQYADDTEYKDVVSWLVSERLFHEIFHAPSEREQLIRDIYYYDLLYGTQLERKIDRFFNYVPEVRSSRITVKTRERFRFIQEQVGRLRQGLDIDGVALDRYVAGSEGVRGNRRKQLIDFLCNMADSPERFVQNTIENIVSILLSKKKLALAFHKELTSGSSGNQQFLALMKELNRLKGHKRYGKLLDGLTIIEEFSCAQNLSTQLSDNNIDPTDRINNVVFAFAPVDQDADMQSVSGTIHSVYVDDEYIDTLGVERSFDKDSYYYPLFDVVAISLFKYHTGYNREDIMKMLGELKIKIDNLNIRDFECPAEIPGSLSVAFLIFRLIPNARRYDRKEPGRQAALRKAIEACA